MNAIFVKTSSEPNLQTEKFSAVSLKVTWPKQVQERLNETWKVVIFTSQKIMKVECFEVKN